MCEKVAVILAGGLGTRLRPYTLVIPKPLVPIGDYPIMEILVRSLVKHGFTRIIMAVNHQADIIKAYFGDGSKWGVSIEYSLESKPLGTMGPLKEIKDLPDDFLVMNGDVLTDLDFSAFLKKHTKNNEYFTISGYKRSNTVDYGVLHVGMDSELTGFEEKPQIDYSVSMGVYAVSKRILEHIPKNTYYGFDSLMFDLLNAKKRVCVETHDGYWLDIGRPSDYERAIEDFNKNREIFFI
ncbi:MAG: NTP transferase domain-containing protein [Ruminococcaceae bacterium]|nr:NTP transferase domain-containing protein [Oscillospiraceae bacterium]